LFVTNNIKVTDGANLSLDDAAGKLDKKKSAMVDFMRTSSEIDKGTINRMITMAPKNEFGKKEEPEKKSEIIKLKKDSPKRKEIKLATYVDKKISKETELFNEIYNVDEQFKHRLKQIKKLKNSFSLIEYQHLIIDMMNDHMGTDYLKKLSQKLREVRDINEKVKITCTINWEEVIEAKKLYQEKKEKLHKRRDSNMSMNSLTSELNYFNELQLRQKKLDALSEMTKKEEDGPVRKKKAMRRKDTKVMYLANFMPPYILDKIKNFL
jgi:hypothetical protein